MRTIVLLFAVLAVMATSTVARAADWKVDKSHSQITFGVSHMVISQVTGSFTDFDVNVQGENDDLAGGNLEATIRAASINTGIERRDNHLRSGDFFDAEEFPTITFKSTNIEKIGDASYKIHGLLTIRNITKPVTFDAVLNGVIRTDKSVRSGWTATLAINRFDYGLHWNKTIETGGLVVGETVHITVNLETLRQLGS